MIDELSTLKEMFRKLEIPSGLLHAYWRPPPDPGRCIFALTTQAISADLKAVVTPCQLGGKPDCHQCGCIAAAAMEAVGRHRLPIGIRAGAIYAVSRAVGLHLKATRAAAFRVDAREPSDQLHRHSATLIGIRPTDRSRASLGRQDQRAQARSSTDSQEDLIHTVQDPPEAGLVNCSPLEYSPH